MNTCLYLFACVTCLFCLLCRYEHMPEVRRIANHRHVPRIVKKAAEAERVQKDKERRKVRNHHYTCYQYLVARAILI